VKGVQRRKGPARGLTAAPAAACRRAGRSALGSNARDHERVAEGAGRPLRSVAVPISTVATFDTST
jgi:hypothetical protein